MSTIHLILQGKGGVGKSFVAGLLAQYLMKNKQSVFCIDADPETPTFSTFPSLNVHQINLIKNDEIDPSLFDKLLRLVEDHQDYEIILDSGASSFVPLCAYLIQTDMIYLLSEMGFTVIIHTLVAGGQEFSETVAGAVKLAKKFPENADMIVWKNEYGGECGITDEEKDEFIPFEQLKAFDAISDRILAIVNLRKQPMLFEKDIRRMVTKRMTFEEVANCEKKELFDFISKHRIWKYQKEVFEQMDVAFGVVPSLCEEDS